MTRVDELEGVTDDEVMASTEGKQMTTKAITREHQQERQGDLPQFVGLEKGADLVDVSVPTLRRWLTQKRLRRFKVGGHTVLKTTELLGLVKEAN
jgi:hypothetical protein